MGIAALKASKVRENFSEFLDNAEKRPVFINRKRNTYVVFPASLMNTPDTWKIKIHFGYDDIDGQRVYFTKNDIFPDVIGWGPTKAEAINSFTEDLKTLCQDFYNNFHIYSSIPARQHQIMPVLRILSILASEGDINEIIEEGKK